MSGLPLSRIEGEDKHTRRSEKNMYLTKPHARAPGGRGSSGRGNVWTTRLGVGERSCGR